MKYNSTPNRAELDNSVSLPPIDLAAPFKYRAEATMAQRTETASSGNMRKLLLNDSKLWGRGQMAPLRKGRSSRAETFAVPAAFTG